MDDDKVGRGVGDEVGAVSSAGLGKDWLRPVGPLEGNIVGTDVALIAGIAVRSIEGNILGKAEGKIVGSNGERDVVVMG